MPRVSGLLIGLALSLVPLTAAEKPQVWLEARSPHFTVFTNGSEKQARRVLEQFEQIRAVFQLAFPRLRLDTSAPVLVFATKDEKTFASLEPLEFKKKGRLKVAGFFQRGPEKNLVLVRLDMERDDLFESVFHEYTHVLLHQNIQSLPLWLDEGLAGFYGATRILDKEIHLGFPSADHVRVLRENASLPLEAVLQADHSSPYYTQQDKGTIFYAQAWALTHYLLIKRGQGGGVNLLVTYLNLVDQGAKSLDAAARAFGDLGKLRSELDNYVRGMGFHFLRVKSSVRPENLTFTIQPLTPADSLARRGDFLAHIQCYADAQAMLEDAIRLDPANALTHESLGFIALRQNQLEEAAKWFGEATRLDSRSYLAHYYHAMLSEKEGQDERHWAEAEASLRRATELNHDFAPAYGALAAVMARQRKDLKGALAIARRAIQLEPGVQGYRLIAASIQMQLGEVDEARGAVELILAAAKTPEDRAEAQGLLTSIRDYQAHLQRQKEAEERARAEAEQFKRDFEEAQKQVAERAEAEKQQEAEAVAKAEQPSPALPARRGRAGWSAGRIISVSCKSPPAMELTLRGTLSSVRLHAGDYFKVKFVTTTWKPPEEFDPCRHLEGRDVAISYRSYEGSPYDGEIVSVEVRK